MINILNLDLIVITLSGSIVIYVFVVSATEESFRKNSVCSCWYVHFCFHDQGSFIG